MLVLVGFAVVIGSVIGGYLMEHGNLSVLVQPAELVIIGGAALGAFLIASPMRVTVATIKSTMGIFAGKSHGKQDYLELLSLLYRLFSKIRKEGLISVEADIENPQRSSIFTKHPGVLKNKHALEFICDNFKVIISTNVPPHELESLTDLEIETAHHEAMIPSHTVTRISDGLPGLGIVAAVLGIVLTMAKIDQPPAVLGQSVGAALVGTFLGVLLCYGFVGPMAVNMEHKANEENTLLQVIKVGLVAFVGGSAPQMAVEFARRAIPGNAKPTFEELEKQVRGSVK